MNSSSYLRVLPIVAHFPKIHRSVLRKITIDLLYFLDVYEVCEKKISPEVRLIHAEQIYLYKIHRFKRKQ